jgi:hypothetical protein
MLKSLWLRLSLSGTSATEERALARYFRDEGLHAELASHLVREPGSHNEQERMLYAARSYFAS